MLILTFFNTHRNKSRNNTLRNKSRQCLYSYSQKTFQIPIRVEWHTVVNRREFKHVVLTAKRINIIAHLQPFPVHAGNSDLNSNVQLGYIHRQTELNWFIGNLVPSTTEILAVSSLHHTLSLPGLNLCLFSSRPSITSSLIVAE